MTNPNGEKPEKPVGPENKNRPKPEAGIEYNLEKLKTYDLKGFKPEIMSFQGHKYDTESWTNALLRLVEVIMYQGLFSKNDLPIYNYTENTKYLINTQAKQKNDKNGKFIKVGNIYVDTKYDANMHLKNISYLFSFLKIKNPQFSLILRKSLKSR